jgi:choline dehydrogenase
MIKRAEEFDYIVVGAGSAGCVLGARLSENPENRVLVLEAGGKDWMPLYKVPLLAGILFRHQYNNWWYETDPEPGLDNRRLRWPRGKVVGGSNQLNGMVYTRGHRLDYDIWRQLGNDGWGYEDVLPYFKKSEDFKGPDSEYHGKGGPLTVTPHGIENQLYDAMIEAGYVAGFPITKDFNDPNREGFGRYHFTIKDGQRWPTARAFLEPAMSRPNLTLRTRCHATRIILDNDQAIGLEYIQNRHTKVVGVTREIVLSGGAINSPQLLLLSGVGPSDQLTDLGIKVQHELSGVGENLHDHLLARLQYATNKNIDLYDQFRLDKAVYHVINALFFRKGLGTSFPLEGGCFIKTRPEIASPDIQCNFVPALIPTTHLPFAKSPLGFKHGFYHGIHQTQPESRGQIKLTTNDPFHPPKIIANYLTTENDRRTMRNGVKIMRNVFRENPMARHILKELKPGEDVKSDVEIDSWIRASGDTVFHPVGTCKMGVDEMAVVDPQLRVHGLKGLRVADASIMPIINGSNTNAPTIMIAEKCADMILNS